MSRKPYLSVLCSAALLAACAPESAPAPESAAPALTSTVAASTVAASTVATPSPENAQAERLGVTAEELAAARASLPTEQRALAASLLMVGVTDFDDALTALRHGAGGIFIGSWTDPALLTEPGRNLQTLKELVGRPFSVSIDAEGGRVQRQPALFGAVPAPREMAQQGSPAQAREIAFELGAGLKRAGITVDFAPVLDVDSGGSDGAIGDRSFSGDPAVAAEYGAAFAQGLRDAGIQPVYKHFPGHGRVSGDSHVENVIAPDLDSVKQVDLAPYGPALAQVPGAVMVGHVQVPGLGDASPSSINPAAYALLRSGDYPGGAPFHGVIYTDDLSGMRAIADHMRTPEAVTAALIAGADCALWISTTDLTATIDAVDLAVTQGRFPREQLLDSALRIRLQQRSEAAN